MEALRIIREYGLHRDGIPYQAQGYVSADGQVFAWKIDEHLLVDNLYNEARVKQ